MLFLNHAKLSKDLFVAGKAEEDVVLDIKSKLDDIQVPNYVRYWLCQSIVPELLRPMIEIIPEYAKEVIFSATDYSLELSLTKEGGGEWKLSGRATFYLINIPIKEDLSPKERSPPLAGVVACYKMTFEVSLSDGDPNKARFELKLDG